MKKIARKLWNAVRLKVIGFMAKPEMAELAQLRVVVPKLREDNARLTHQNEVTTGALRMSETFLAETSQELEETRGETTRLRTDLQTALDHQAETDDRLTEANDNLMLADQAIARLQEAMRQMAWEYSRTGRGRGVLVEAELAMIRAQYIRRYPEGSQYYYAFGDYPPLYPIQAEQSAAMAATVAN